MALLDDYADAVANLQVQPGGERAEALRVARRAVVAAYDRASLSAEEKTDA